MLERRRLQQLREHVGVIAGRHRSPPLRASRVRAARRAAPRTR
jgi:hypothetical protein